MAVVLLPSAPLLYSKLQRGSGVVKALAGPQEGAWQPRRRYRRRARVRGAAGPTPTVSAFVRKNRGGHAPSNAPSRYLTRPSGKNPVSASLGGGQALAARRAPGWRTRPPSIPRALCPRTLPRKPLPIKYFRPPSQQVV